MRVGLLELAHAGTGDGAGAALASVVDVARLAGDAGVGRLWFAEHHDPGHVAAAPDVLCARVADVAGPVRLGVAGVLLRVHPPWAVAERWSVVSHLVAGGVDLGVARGDVEPRRAAALGDGRPPSPPADFEGRVAALVSHLSGAVGPPLEPRPAPGVQVWLHGRRSASAEVARRFGLPYCHAHFLGPPTAAPPGAAAVAVAGVCASTGAEAAAWASSGAGAFTPTLVGGADGWRRELARLHEQGVAEVVFADLCAAPAHHRRSVALFASTAASV